MVNTGQICRIILELDKAVIPSTTQRCLNAHNLEKLKNVQANENWKTVTNTQTTNGAYNEFNKILVKALDTDCPLVNVRPKMKSSHRSKSKTRA